MDDKATARGALYADGTACDEPGTLCGNICLDDQCWALFDSQRGDG